MSTLTRQKPVLARRALDWQLVVALVMIAGFIVIAIVGLFMQTQANTVNVADSLQPPSPEHLQSMPLIPFSGSL